VLALRPPAAGYHGPLSDSRGSLHRISIVDVVEEAAVFRGKTVPRLRRDVEFVVAHLDMVVSAQQSEPGIVGTGPGIGAVAYRHREDHQLQKPVPCVPGCDFPSLRQSRIGLASLQKPCKELMMLGSRSWPTMPTLELKPPGAGSG
jgi:hypothetical protein